MYYLYYDQFNIVILIIQHTSSNCNNLAMYNPSKQYKRSLKPSQHFKVRIGLCLVPKNSLWHHFRMQSFASVKVINGKNLPKLTLKLHI